MKSSVKKIIKYLLLFFFFLVWNLFLLPVNIDEIWNYGFSISIFKGLVPYLDFNMILTPLYPFLMSLPFHIFGCDEIVFQIMNSLMLAGVFFFLDDLFKNKSFIYILLLCFPMPIIFPSYNIFLFILFVILLWCEKNNKNDYLIGVILAGFCLTKQTVGVLIALVGLLFYIKDKKKIFKRLVGFIIPCFVFLVYLLVTGSFMHFLDLCLFGLFDFTADNGDFFNIFVIIFMALVGLTINIIRKKPKNIEGWYALAFYSVMIPLFDLYHTQLGFLAFIMLLMFEDIKIFNKLNYKLFVIGVLSGISLLHFKYLEKTIYPNDINHFEYRYIDKFSIELTKQISDFMKEHSKEKIILLTSNAYYFKIVNDLEITHFDLINKGNMGYDGSRKLVEKIKKVEDDAIFLVGTFELELEGQLEKAPFYYVIENGKKIDRVGIYDVYVLE